MTHPETENLIIIGSGPAAWTAAIYAARAELSPLVFEGEITQKMIPGGQLMWTTDIENYPGFPGGIGGQELMQRMKDQAVEVGARIVTDAIAAVDFSGHPLRVKPKYSDSWIETATAIIATGARANWLGLPNEERLARSGGGVSACAVCDGALPAFRDRRLLVVGGGDTSMEEAIYLSKFASEVVVIHRRDTLRASAIMAQKAFDNPTIRFEWNTQVVEVQGEDFITGVRVEDTVTGQQREIEAGGLFVAIGHTPNTAFLGGALALDEHGYITPAVAGRTATSAPGVFAAGDVMDDYYRQAITAAGTGCMAALEAERWLSVRGG